MARNSTWFFRFAASVSLLLWLATAIAWPMSYWQAVMLRPAVNGRQSRMYVLNSGRIVAQDFLNISNKVTPPDPIIEWMTPQPVSILSFNRDANHLAAVGFERWWSIGSAQFPFFMLAIPLWFPFLLFAWPIIPLIRRRRRAATSGVFCEQCGYDLRATPKRCPECGKIRGSLGDGSPA